MALARKVDRPVLKREKKMDVVGIARVDLVDRGGYPRAQQ